MVNTDSNQVASISKSITNISLLVEHLSSQEAALSNNIRKLEVINDKMKFCINKNLSL